MIYIWILNFLGFDETLDQVDIAQQDGIQLVTSLDDILEQKIGLGYLLQFLISKNQEALIRFWLDVTSFIEVSRYQKSYATDQVKNKVNMNLAFNNI